MSLINRAALTAMFSVAAMMVQAETLTLAPADPQPDPSALSQGLSVTYAYPGDVKNIKSATKSVEKWGKPGPALRGFSYDDTKEGDITLTSKRAMKVAAGITGYIKFDAPGSYVIDFLTNDGLLAHIGGQEVADYDDIHPCGYSGEIDVEVPTAGYYEIEAVYFQRKGTSCLMMEWGATSDDLELVPDSAFFHAE